MIALVRAMPAGGELWVPGFGASLWPWLRSGDAVRVRRLSGALPRLGELVLCAGTRGGQWVHPVVEVEPVRTASLRGVVDPPGEVLARVVAVRRGARVVPVPSGVRWVAAAWSQTAVELRRSPRALALWREGVDAATSRRTAPLRRRWLGAWTVRPIASGDEAAVLRFGGDHFPTALAMVQRELRARWLEEGTAVGAFTTRGPLAGFAYLGRFSDEGVPVDGVFVRHLHVRPLARNFGVARALVRKLVHIAFERGVPELLADVRAENLASRALLESEGFVERSDAGARATVARLEASLGPRPLLLLGRRLGSP